MNYYNCVHCLYGLAEFCSQTEVWSNSIEINERFATDVDESRIWSTKLVVLPIKKKNS